LGGAGTPGFFVLEKVVFAKKSNFAGKSGIKKRVREKDIAG
jgi:hypothetical protein